ncbi:4Fe-4S cluster-binding domain-containing protein, partial [Methanosalsum natronophilum]
MEVNYSSSVSVSTVDWYGRASTVLFFNQCPFRCPYCQNHELLEKNELIDISVPKQDIIKSIPFVSAVVFSGGEPLLHMNGLLELASFAKEKGLLVGVETNGFFDESI